MKYYFFIDIIYFCNSNCSVCNRYSSPQRYICITIITQFWLILMLDFNTEVLNLVLLMLCVRSMQVILYFNPIFGPKFRWLISCIVWKFLIFFYYVILLTLKSSIIFFFWRYTSFSWYFSIKSHVFCFIFDCLWIILLWNYSECCNFIGNFITNQIANCFSWIAVFDIF